MYDIMPKTTIPITNEIINCKNLLPFVVSLPTISRKKLPKSQNDGMIITIKANTTKIMAIGSFILIFLC